MKASCDAMCGVHATTWLFGFLFWLVGLSSWMTITALFSELSLMMRALPEKFNIFSDLALIIQLANIVPLIYTLCIPKHLKTSRFVANTGYLIISFSFLSMLLMAYHYEDTLPLFSQPRSIILFILTFAASTCDCMTSLIYWRWVSSYPSQYIAFLSAGEPSSGIVAAILIWTQQFGIDLDSETPRFSVRTYLLIIACILPVSFGAFKVLNVSLRRGYFETERDWIVSKDDNTNDEGQKEGLYSISKTESQRNESTTIPIVHMESEQLINRSSKSSFNSSFSELWKYGLRKYQNVHWVLVIGLISAVQNGAVPSLSSFALIPFDDGAVYVYAVAISNLLKPSMAILTAYYPNLLITLQSIIGFCIGWTVCLIYILYVALQSPTPLGQYNAWCMSLIVVAFVLCNVLLTLSKTCVIMMVKKEFMSQSRLIHRIQLKTIWDRQIGGVMERVGLGIQFGSFIGALTFFILMNVIPITLFHS